MALRSSVQLEYIDITEFIFNPSAVIDKIKFVDAG